MNQSFISILQVRMTSTRLPGKTMRVACGKPMLGYIIDRIKRSRLLQDVIVATSDTPSDAPIRTYCSKNKIQCAVGSLHNVALRVLDVMNAFPADAYVRICGDSPFMDSEVIDNVVALYKEKSPDLATNVYPRTFPKGVSVEVLNPSTYTQVAPMLTDPEDQEHVTRYFYQHADAFSICNVSNPDAILCNDLSIDTEEQWNRFVAFVEKTGSRWMQMGWREIDRRMARLC